MFRSEEREAVLIDAMAELKSAEENMKDDLEHGCFLEFYFPKTKELEELK